MPFKRKPVVTVGVGDWKVSVPNPPKHATHARLVCDKDPLEKGRAKIAVLPIADIKCFEGVSGWFQYIRMNKQRKVLEEYTGEWYWNGREVEGIE
ncbi:hypothetical protein CMI37_03895 [Candidatus Pacearchaeota archaeon]|nr:hypothetical protein [Candidatus Pacearchaeota archaeon]|tara:strand:- start:234 stop:518 length:285 start_codon:yes stop_codon:yes gene_type:complete